ncbi:glycosyltransferase family 4 protein [Litoribacter alkaliphilus]|uniref:Glycosyltransferase family 4 protein n=1 Tax=Litoribacter ruber TaxID=702568 RepID=A0AAP2CM94_9BACT|nr:glycosyltransferase family 4 protein [Litoribacter alkaliphilus]MBS9524517.1 glycosyltransferase family 4 protein [Litoribacter alkaliphilus]
MKVLFYTAACMLDISLEYINMIKHKSQLHVLIEITPLTKGSNILNIEHLPNQPALMSPIELLSNEDLKYFQYYFQGVASVQFVVHTTKSGLSLKSLKASQMAANFISALNPDIIHYELETMSLRSLWLVRCFNACKNLQITIHDPEQHPGETNIKTIFARRIFANLNVQKFHFYSSYAKNRYYQKFKEKGPHEIIQMRTYSFYRNFIHPIEKKHAHILFFGRISKYKGVDIFLNSITKVLKSHPHTQFIIAGKESNGYVLENSIIKNHPRNIQYMNRHIGNKELAELVYHAKFTVCPYIEASQSGVLMTSYAMSTPVLATRVGAFPEYVIENFNGCLVQPNDVDALANKIIELLENNAYLKMTQNLRDEIDNPKEHTLTLR